MATEDPDARRLSAGEAPEAITSTRSAEEDVADTASSHEAAQFVTPLSTPPAAAAATGDPVDSIPITVAPPHAVADAREPQTPVHDAVRKTADATSSVKRDSGLSPSVVAVATSPRAASAAPAPDAAASTDASGDTAVAPAAEAGNPPLATNIESTKAAGAAALAAIPIPPIPLSATHSTSNVSNGRPTTATKEQKPSWWKRSWGKKSGSRFLSSTRSMESLAPPDAPSHAESPFSPLTTNIPTEDLLQVEALSFSHRGSVLLSGKKAVFRRSRQATTHKYDRFTLSGVANQSRRPSISLLAASFENPKMLPDDVVKESEKVRSMYEADIPLDGQHGKPAEQMAEAEQEPRQGPSSASVAEEPERPRTAMSDVGSTRRMYELAGGIEDWEDVEGGDVDRYGFISAPKTSLQEEADTRRVQRVSTSLQLASEAPRKRRGLGRSSSTASRTSTRSNGQRTVLAKSVNTTGSGSIRSNRSTPFRHAANRLPGNRDRRWMDEAGDMLTLPPGLADIAEEEDDGRGAEEMKRKEWERAEKWQKMAKVKRGAKDGEGLDYEFDPNDPKVIERTWKGIPDRWRATAWYSFLSASARKHADSPSDEELVLAFQRLLHASSADDVQIDIDVPRTINSHIMFRTRYRGGQRLLFRVLHCFSLFAADTGYVQGMASLAATLLCYFDEERAFVMLVRMWQLRGLNRLYEPGFAGLMAALDEFQTQWLAGSPVAKQLSDLCVEPTSYGTRWYLTLFNYSIPFVAQLRVWDVFMLLGDADHAPGSDGSASSSASPHSGSLSPSAASAAPASPFGGGLDVLHATAAALIDGTREILLDSDFENAMKVLTSWIPIKDEELLMRVTKAEWKLHRHGRRRV